jgi:hypothetical protein
MTENSANDATDSDSAVGADRIDAYIQSVEQVLLASAVPIGERYQVLSDLATQISEMLERQRLPITEDKVQAVLEQLEPPSHFAAIYGASSDSRPATPAANIPYSRPIVLAVIACFLIPLGCLLLLLLAAGDSPAGFAIFAIVPLVCAFITPIALHQGIAQLRAEPSQFRGRELAIVATITYYSVVPLLLLLFGIALTDGVVLFPLAVAAFVYWQYLLVRRLCRGIVVTIPKSANGGSLRETLRQYTWPVQPAVGI